MSAPTRFLSEWRKIAVGSARCVVGDDLYLGARADELGTFEVYAYPTSGAATLAHGRGYENEQAARDAADAWIRLNPDLAPGQLPPAVDDVEAAALAAYEQWRAQQVAAGRHEPEDCPCRDGHDSPDLCEILCSRCGGSGGPHPKHDRRGCSKCSRDLRGWDGITEAARERYCAQVTPIVAVLSERAHRELLVVRAALRNCSPRERDAACEVLRQVRPFVERALAHAPPRDWPGPSGREFRADVERVLGLIDAALLGGGA